LTFRGTLFSAYARTPALSLWLFTPPSANFKTTFSQSPTSPTLSIADASKQNRLLKLAAA
jgi:hypothetical protein